MSDTENKDHKGEVAVEPPRYYAGLIDDIIIQLEAFFAEHLELMFTQADDHLFAAADDATSTAEQTSLFECMNALRKNKQRIQQAFVVEFGHYLQAVSELKKLPSKKQSKKATTLGLVEQHEMDEMVTLSTISSKAAADNAEAIGHLIKRLHELAQYNDHIFHGEALEPKILCDVMHEVVGQTDLIDENKLVVYRFFNKGLLKDLSKLYDGLNTLLIEQGILPEIDFSGMAPQFENAGNDGAGEEVSPADENQPPQQPPQGAPQGAPQGGRRSFGSGMQGYPGYSSAAGQAPAASSGQAGGPPQHPQSSPQHPGQHPPQHSGPYPGPGSGSGQYPSQGAGHASGGGPRRSFGSGIQSFAPAQPMYHPESAAAGHEAATGHAPAASGASSGVSMGPSGQAYSAGMPVGQVRQNIENFVGGTHADAMSGGAGYYSHQQVMTALTELQMPVGELSQTPLVFDANKIKKAVLSSIGETEGGVVSKAVNQVSEKTIDFIKLIFDGIIEEDSITDEIKTLLLSLQIPVIKAAMLDAEFFVDDQHPARQLLDKIAEAGVGVSEHTDPVYIDIEKVVRKLLQDYDEDVIAFTVALDELSALTEEIYRKARETEAESQKTVKMAHAKKIVLQEIRKITLGKELPQGVRTLVLKVWPSMMFNHYLKNGKANDEWVELLMILQKIIESVQPIHYKEELEELGLSYQDIVSAARSKLGNYRNQQAVIDEVLQELGATYKALMLSTELQDEEAPQLDVSLLPPVADTAAGDEKIAEAKADLADELSLNQAEAQAAPAPETVLDPEKVAREKISKLPEGVSPGAWCIVYNGEDKPVRRLKLAVILLQDATMVFVDHLGNVVIEKDAEDFAEEIENGMSGIIMQHSVFDHALNSALKTIER